MDQIIRNISRVAAVFGLVAIQTACGLNGGGFASRTTSDSGSSVLPPGSTPTPTPTPAPPVSQVGKIMQIDVSSAGVAGNDVVSGRPSFSDDGRYVAFVSAATNLVPNDNNGVADVFVRDLLLNTTIRVSVSSVGTESDGASSEAKISGNGRYVVFTTSATNLIPSDTNGWSDIYRRDMQTGVTELMSATVGGAQTNHQSLFPSISRDGNLVAFVSRASNLVTGVSDNASSQDIFLKNATTGAVTLLTEHRDGMGNRTGTAGIGTLGLPRVSADGLTVTFHTGANDIDFDAGDTNGVRDVYQFVIADDSITRISKSAMNALADADCWAPSVSENGRYVTFHSLSTTLTTDTNGFSDLFRIDIMTGEVTIASLTSTGAQGNQNCSESDISADGSTVVFHCAATNMVPDDTNGVQDVFVRSGTTTTRVSVLQDGTEMNAASEFGTISGDMKKIAFNSLATNVPDASTDGLKHLYVKILAD